MKLFGRSTWRRCTYIFLALLMFQALQLLWVYFTGNTFGDKGVSINYVTNERNRLMLEKFPNKSHFLQEHPNDSRGNSMVVQAGKDLVEQISMTKGHKNDHERNCAPIVPFKKLSPNTISTFDIPEVADYSLDENGRYKLPRMDLKSHDARADDVVHVTLVPFSHADPGYGQTMEGYYSSSTKNVLDLMVEKLTTYRNMTFQWAETVFLERWFRDITQAKKEQVKDLIKRGQLEIVLGSWVMPDEAVTRFGPVVDQLIEGHQWVAENLQVVPENAWVNDPFGYSSTMPYLWKSSGIENMVILRIHQAVKAFLMSKNSMEFRWRPYWKRSSKNDILCNLMPYEGYWNSNVCGPKESICRLFNFLHLDRSDSAAKRVHSGNLKELAEKLYEQYSFTARFYKYNNLVIFLGEDNSYNSPNSWDDTYANYGMLMNYINSQQKMKMRIEFGTLKEYFARVRKTEKDSSFVLPSEYFPVLSGDFFPYSDWENAYWTGYFTTRPWLKKLSRELETLLRSADIFSVLTYNFCKISGMCPKNDNLFRSIYSDLRLARRELGMFQHHDGITGTSLPNVVQDYETRLNKGLKCAQQALQLVFVTLLSNGTEQDPNAVLLQRRYSVNTKSFLNEKRGYEFKAGKLTILIANPLERTRKEIVDIRTRTKSFVIRRSDQPSLHIPYQLTIPSDQTGLGDEIHLISFSITLNPFSFNLFTIEETQEESLMTEVREQIPMTSDSNLTISNAYLTITFNSDTGMLDNVRDISGRETQLDAEFLKYNTKTSGAYLFGPEGPAGPIPELTTPPRILVTKGHFLSEVKVMHASGFTQKVRLYNISGDQGGVIHVRNEIDLGKTRSLSNIEVIWRLKTDVQNGQLFFTDQNGFQFLGRKTYPDRPIQSNYYPVTTMAFIEDEVKRLTLHVAQPHGVSSLENGWLEVMLDRTMFTDDGRGLGMGVTDKVLAISDFVIQIEYKTRRIALEEMRYNHATLGNIMINEQLQNPLNIFTVVDKIQDKVNVKMEAPLLQPKFPCGISIAGLRNLVRNDLTFNGTSLVLHRQSISCLFPATSDACAMTRESLSFEKLTFGVDLQAVKHRKLLETSLSHLRIKQEVLPSEDIRPQDQELRSFVIKYKDTP